MYKEFCTQMFLKMYHFEIQLPYFFFLLLLLFSFHAESNGMQSLIQHFPDLDETKWSNESWMHTVVMQPLQVA